MRHETAKALKTLIAKATNLLALSHAESASIARSDTRQAVEALRVALTFEVQDDDRNGDWIDGQSESGEVAEIGHLLDYFGDAAQNPSEHHYVERAEIPNHSRWEANHTGDHTIVWSASLGSVSHQHVGEADRCIISFDGFLEIYTRVSVWP